MPPPPPWPTVSAARPRPRTRARGPHPHGGPLHGLDAALRERAEPRRSRGSGQQRTGFAEQACHHRLLGPIEDCLPGFVRQPFQYLVPRLVRRPRLCGLCDAPRLVRRPRLCPVPRVVRQTRPHRAPRLRRRGRVQHSSLADHREVERQRAPLQPVQYAGHLLRSARGHQEPHPAALQGHRGPRDQVAQGRPSRLGRHIQNVEAQTHRELHRGPGDAQSSGRRGRRGHCPPAQYVLVPPAGPVARIERSTRERDRGGSGGDRGRLPTMPSATVEAAHKLRCVPFRAPRVLDLGRAKERGDTRLFAHSGANRCLRHGVCQSQRVRHP